MDWILFALFGLLGLGQLIDWARERRRDRANKDKPICGCTHHHAYHDPRTGICKGTVRRGKGLDDNLTRIYSYHECNCQQYSGPMPEIDYRIIGELYGTPASSPVDPKE
jgi:hypothetical protein